ncbi:Apoptosis 1 inhibitor [Ooceraea biroi]|uniref:Apoptosis 1 inhibitor n=1 Tax=Ooceraea biroi TaxID=2015173 RepID=A0A026W4X9_OOCBI|nr:Apoptosis 1 inhibitor [Ooceraea biroi]
MVYPEYSSYDTRLDSFKSCSNEHRQFLEQLADAGFFYTGNANETRCFYCSLQVRDWYANNDPWKMHASQMSTCPYLLLIKDLCYTERDEKLWQRSLRSQELPIRRPWEETRNEHIPVLSRTHRNQSSQRDIENMSNNVADLSSRDENSKKGAAYASVTRSFRSDEQSLQCRFCITGVRDYVFMNCRHIVACEKCAYEVTICQICGQKISSRLKVRYS